MLLLFKTIFLNYFLFTYILVVQANDNLLIKEWKCANRHCTVPISNGEAKREYKNPDHDLKLKFKHLDKLTVLRKPFDDKADYWWIRLEDDENLEGYANKNFIKETKVLTNNNALIKVTENELNPNSSISPTSPKGYDVVDGTTIYGYDGIPSPLVDNSLPVDNSNVVNTTDSEKEDVDDDDGEVEIEDEGDSSVFEAISSQYEKPPPVDTVKSSDIEPENSSKSDEINSANSIETDSIVSLPSAPESITTSSPDISQETSDQSLNSQTLNGTVSEELQNVGKINENANQDGILSSIVSEKLQNAGKLNENANQDGILSSTVSEKLQNVGKTNENANQDGILSSTVSEKLQNIGKTNENANQDGILSSTVSEKLQNVGKLDENANQDDILSSTVSEKLQNVGKLNENANQDDILSSTTESSLNSSVNLNETENKEDIVYNSESSPSPLVNDNNEKHIDIQPLNENVIANTIEKLQNNETNTLPSENNTNESDSTTTESINLAESEKSFSSTELPTYSVDTNLSSDISKSKDISIESSVSEESTKSTTEVNFIENNVPQPEQIVKDYDNINNYTQSFDNIPVEKKELDSNNIDPPKLETDDYPYPVTTEAIPLDVHQIEEHTEYDKSIETSTETIVPDEIQLTTEIPNYYKSEDVTEPVAAVDDNQILESPPVEDNKIIEESKPVVPDIIEENVEDSSQNWFSSVYSLMDSVKELYLSTVGTNINAENNLVNEEIVETFKNISPEKCDEQSSDEYCMKKKLDESSTSSLQDSEPMPDTLQPELNSNFDDSNNNSWPSFKSLFWIIISTHVILCFSLGYYYLDNWKRDCELVQKNNILAGDLFVLEREKTILEEEFSVLKEDMQKILEEKTVIDNEIDSIKEELRKTKEEKQNAEEKELKLVKKLKMIEQNYNELRKIFSESKQKGDRSALIADIKKLKDSIAEYNVEISALKEELQEKKNEIKQLNVNLQKSNEAKMALQERFDKLVIEGQEVAKGYQETLSKMEQTIEENKTVQTNLEKDLRKHKKKCESLEIEKELAESALHKAHGITSAESLADWLEVKEVRCSLLAAQKEISKLSTERDSLSQRLDSVEEKCKKFI
ncbi:hypothetical protein O3M35_007941 [Rhynocoris fuscipes]|uniref:Transport and Golgi organization protein 1 n=1 Tax=Rhynocoris fuscipes TaxID=488301 RepID=A0AAW1DIH6_9HEMI